MIYLKAFTLALLFVLAAPAPAIVVCTVCLFLAQKVMK